MNITIEIENFRSILKTKLTLKKSQINILIGPNGSGKSSLLAALKFLHDLLVDGVAMSMAKNGGTVRNFHRGKDVIKFKINHFYGYYVFNRKRVPFYFSWEIGIAERKSDNLPIIFREKFRIYTIADYRIKEILHINLIRSEEGQTQIEHSIFNKNLIGHDVFNIRNEPRHTIRKTIDKVEKNLISISQELKKTEDISLIGYLHLFSENLSYDLKDYLYLDQFDINPDSARQPRVQLPFANLESDGTGLVDVIDALINKQFYRFNANMRFPSERRNYWVPSRTRPSLYNKSDILETINTELNIAIGSIDHISTSIDPTNGKRFLLFHSKDNTFYPYEVSDGTIKWLSILVSIFVSQPTIYLLEEPENFLHPWMQQRLVEIMREQAKDKSITFVLTSHSATLLNAALPDEVIVVCKDTNGGTEAKRLHDMEKIAKTLENSKFGVGDLWVSGILGAVPAGDE